MFTLAFDDLVYDLPTAQLQIMTDVRDYIGEHNLVITEISEMDASTIFETHLNVVIVDFCETATL